jgi:hypothetical protein
VYTVKFTSGPTRDREKIAEIVKELDQIVALYLKSKLAFATEEFNNVKFKVDFEHEFNYNDKVENNILEDFS